MFTNMTPTGSYRGAGKPEFIYIIERLVDVAARELKIDPVELRRRNLVSAKAMPFRNAMGDTFDVGDFIKNLDDVLRLADRDGFRYSRRAARTGGKLRGFGLSVYMEPDGLRAAGLASCSTRRE